MKRASLREPQLAPGTAERSADAHADIWARLPRPLRGSGALLAGALLVTVATVIGAGLTHWLPQQSVPLVYLLCVVLAAIGLGMWSGLAAAFLAFLAYNFFFISPTLTFTIADRQELFALIVFFVVALLTGSVAGRMREAADRSRQRAMTLLSLNDFAATLAGQSDMVSIIDALTVQAAAIVRGQAVLLLQDKERLEIRAAVPPDIDLEPEDWQAAQRTCRSGKTNFAAAPGWPGARFEFRPLMTSRDVIGAIGLAPGDGRRAVADEDNAALETVLRHAAIAIERTQLAAESAMARDEAERERMRSALLSSLSHDLRTPLASILGAVTSLRQLGPSLPPEARADLLTAIEEETGRLARFVSNLLDMTRLNTGAPYLGQDWLDVADAAQIAVARAKKYFPEVSIQLSAEPSIPVVHGDETLFEHVVFNLLDNAVKFSEPGQQVAVSVTSRGDAVELTVTDQGRGIAKEQLAAVFEKFYRVRNGAADMPGTGLGLTICKRVVEDMGGTIRAESPVAGNRGTRIVVRIPAPVTGGAAIDAAPLEAKTR
jgi:two-component system sensor histidine kinase KdpD